MMKVPFARKRTSLKHSKTCSKNKELSKSYSVIMKSIEEGAIEALMYMSDKPKSAFVSSLETI